MKKSIIKMTSLVLLSVLTVGLGGCGSADGSGSIGKNISGGDAETFTVKPLAIWYLASDSTSDYTGDIRAYSSDGYSSLYQWAQDNEGDFLTSAGQGEDENISLTMNDSQRQKLLEIVEKKYAQVLEELPDVCDLFEKAEIAEDQKEFDIYFDPDAWLEKDLSSVAGLMDFENLIILEDYWQLMEELEKGSDYVGTVVWKNANTGYQLLSFSSDPDVTDSIDFATAAVRHTNYSDYEGKLDFTAKYIGEFTDGGYDGKFFEFEIIDDSCYEEGEKVCFYVEELPVEVSEGTSVNVIFSGDNAPNDYAFEAHEQEVCFDDGIPFEMTLADNS